MFFSVKKNEVGIVIVCHYVDDLAIFGTKESIQAFKNDMVKFFTLKLLGTLDAFLA